MQFMFITAGADYGGADDTISEEFYVDDAGRLDRPYIKTMTGVWTVYGAERVLRGSHRKEVKTWAEWPQWKDLRFGKVLWMYAKRRPIWSMLLVHENVLAGYPKVKYLSVLGE